ncbi:MAG: AAA family ATPase [Streptosporangiales bacterium]|nr:AAA family ATPase [Streptosporangiales bacterium]
MSRETARRPPSELPEEQTTFVGRAAELSGVGDALKSARLVTVTGAGGVGKTRLARRAAAAAEASFPDGVRLVELSRLHDPQLLANTVAAALALPEQDPRPRLDQVLDYLAGRQVMLILDTCEHLIEACALFAEAVLTRTGNVTILATSREPLFVAGEHEYPLAPFAVPGPGSGSGAPGDALELFAQRASAAAPGFAITDATRPDAARLCRHLDGIPLAIELAAVQLREVSLAGLADRMNERFLDLTGRQPGVTGRHQTLRDAIGWSYELCAPAERVLWERLSVFSGPVSADTITQVCSGAGLSGDSVMNALIGLVDKSVASRGGDGVSRYGMLDSIREYGTERLAASGAGSRARARHLHRYLGLADELSASPLEHQVPRYQALRAEHPDIRTALKHAGAVAEAGDSGHPALRLPAGLFWYWLISGRLDEGKYWLTRGLEHAAEPAPARARALITRSYLSYNQGDAQSSIADAEAGMALADGPGERLLRARGLAYLAHGLAGAGRLAEGKEAAASARKLLGSSADEPDVAVQLGIIEAYLCLLAGDPAGCLLHCERTLPRVPYERGERWSSGYLHGLAGLALCLQGRPGEGSGPVLRGLAMKHELGDTVGIAHGLGVAALVAASQKRPERAAWLIGAAGALWEQIGSVFLGVPAMQALTEQSASAARDALGGARYDEVVRTAASRQVDQIVDLAVRDADRLPALSSAR